MLAVVQKNFTVWNDHRWACAQVGQCPEGSMPQGAHASGACVSRRERAAGSHMTSSISHRSSTMLWHHTAGGCFTVTAPHSVAGQWLGLAGMCCKWMLPLFHLAPPSGSEKISMVFSSNTLGSTKLKAFMGSPQVLGVDTTESISMTEQASGVMIHCYLDYDYVHLNHAHHNCLSKH